MSKVERIAFIGRALRNGGSVRLRDVMDEFCVSARQAARDIEYLRYSCDAPLEYDQKTRSYRYTEPYSDLDFLEEDALISRVLIHRLALSSPFIPLNASEIDRRLDGFVPPRLKPLEQAVRFELSSFEPVNRPLVSMIMTALLEKRQVALEYTDIEGRASRRTIEPRRIVNYSGAWYCYAVDVDKGAVRSFKLSRVVRPRLLDARHASPISDAEIDERIDNAYGAYKGVGTVDATIRFYGPARSIVEHEIWHPSQVVEDGIDPSGNNYIELTVPVFRFEELLGRVLRFGSHARPTSPEAFIEAWKHEIDAMHAIILEV